MSYVLLSEAYPKARKVHRCIWCGQTIEPSTQYRVESSRYDGQWQNFKWHLECNKAFASHFSREGEEFTPYENERPPDSFMPDAPAA